MPKRQFHTIFFIFFIFWQNKKDFTEHKRKKDNFIQFNCYTLSQIVGTGVLTSVGVKTGWTMDTSLLLSFFWRRITKWRNCLKISGENSLFFFLKKNSPNSSLFWGSMSSPVCLSVSLSTGHNFNDPVQKVSPVKAKSV